MAEKSIIYDTVKYKTNKIDNDVYHVNFLYIRRDKSFCRA